MLLVVFAVGLFGKELPVLKLAQETAKTNALTKFDVVAYDFVRGASCVAVTGGTHRRGSLLKKDEKGVTFLSGTTRCTCVCVCAFIFLEGGQQFRQYRYYVWPD